MYPTAPPVLRFVLCHPAARRGSQEGRSTSVSSRLWSASHHRTLRSLSGLWEQPNSWALPSTCVRGTLPARDALEDTLKKNHPATIRGGGKLKVQSAVLPCVLAKSRLSTTLLRLWPAAPLTVTVQRAGKKGTMSDVLRTAGCSHQPPVAMRGIFPRSPKGPGPFEYFKASMAQWKLVPVNQEAQQRGPLRIAIPEPPRRPSWRQTNTPAGSWKRDRDEGMDMMHALTGKPTVR